MFKIGIDAHNLEIGRAGVARYLSELLQEFSRIPEVKEKYQFYLYFKAKVPDDEFLQANMTKKDALFVPRVLQLKPLPASFMFHFNVLLPFWAQQDGLDLFFFPDYMMPFLFPVPAVITIHDVCYEAHPDWFALRARLPYRLLSRQGARTAKAIITISEFSKKEISRYYGVNPAKIFVNYIGIARKFKPLDDVNKLEQVKKDYGLKNKFIFFMAQVFNRRCLKESMLAFAKLCQQEPRMKDYQFLAIGPNRSYPFIDFTSLANKINTQLGRQAIIYIKEHIPDKDLGPLYKAASLFVYVSLYEGQGLPPLEAAACGTAILAGPYEPAKEILPEAFFNVPEPRQIDDFAARMKNALFNEAERQEKIGKAVKSVHQLNSATNAQKTLRIFDKLLCQTKK